MTLLSAFEVLDRRLNPAASAPIGVAYSGGGDSLLALKTVKRWADRHGRVVVALAVDHQLQAASHAWTETAGRTAGRLGVEFRSLAWTGPKPTAGLADAARTARHRLIAEAARAAGARVVVFGHTADDQIEGRLMRAEGLRLGSLREWSPSPVWPQGRGLFLLRPLLGMRRAAIRAALAADGETWIDDPANQDPKSPRARVRAQAGRIRETPPSPPDADALADLARAAEIGDGHIRLDRAALNGAPADAMIRLLGAAVCCAGGQERPPRGRRLETLAGRLRAGGAFTATLAGAKLLADEAVLIVRDAGEARRGGLAPLTLAPGEGGVWDGRFEARADQTGLTVGALSGRMSALSAADQARARTVPAAARPALPILTPDRSDAALPNPAPILASATAPILATGGAGGVRPLIAARFGAGCGVISKEPAT